MTIRRLSRNATAGIAQAALIGAFLFELYRLLTKELGTERVGAWALVLGSVSAARLSDLGLGASVTRFVAVDSGAGDLSRAARTAGVAVLAVAVLMGTVCIALEPLLARLLSVGIQDVRLYHAALAVLPASLLAVWMASVANVLLGALDGLQRSDLRAWVVVYPHY